MHTRDETKKHPSKWARRWRKTRLMATVATMACLLLAGCSTPRQTPDEMYASEMAEVLAAAEAVYMEFAAAELELGARGGTMTLPDEFHEWVTDDMFQLVERFMQGLFDKGVHLSGETHDEVTHFVFADGVELRPQTYMVAYVCGKNWGAISTDRDGNVLNNGAPSAYRRTVWFSKEGSPLAVKVAWIIDEGDQTCEG